MMEDFNHNLSEENNWWRQWGLYLEIHSRCINDDDAFWTPDCIHNQIILLGCLMSECMGKDCMTMVMAFVPYEFLEYPGGYHVTYPPQFCFSYLEDILKGNHVKTSFAKGEIEVYEANQRWLFLAELVW